MYKGRCDGRPQYVKTFSLTAPKGQDARSANNSTLATKSCSMGLMVCGLYLRFGKTRQYPKKSQNIVRIKKMCIFAAESGINPD